MENMPTFLKYQQTFFYMSSYTVLTNSPPKQAVMDTSIVSANCNSMQLKYTYLAT